MSRRTEELDVAYSETSASDASHGQTQSRVELPSSDLGKDKSGWLQRLDERRKAEDCEERAGSYGESQPERGKALLAAGYSYLKADDPRLAVKNLRLAEAPMKIWLLSGTEDAYMSAADLYWCLGYACRLTGQIADSQVAHDKAAELVTNIEKYFDVQVTFPASSALQPELPIAQ